MKTKDQKENPTDESLNSTATVDKSRRAFAKAGAAAPVIMTMASRPVFGAVECASAMVSTTHTSHSPLEECWGGLSPGYWLNPVGETGKGNTVFEAWDLAVGVADSYGIYKGSGKKHKWENYNEGALYSVTGFNNPGSYTLLREVLGNYKGDEVGRWHYIAAWLNFHYAAAKSISYVLNAQDFALAVSNETLSNIVKTLYDK